LSLLQPAVAAKANTAVATQMRALLMNILSQELTLMSTPMARFEHALAELASAPRPNTATDPGIANAIAISWIGKTSAPQ
jgi:hypothetical protein